MTEKDFSDELNQIPKPEVPHIRVKEIREISIPHPYCITPKHISHASDHYHGILGEAAIIDAEKHGAKCDICRKINKKHGKPILPFSEHIAQKTLFIEVPQNKDLNAVEGLHAYLLKIKPIAESLKIDGFAFPTFSKG
ncbi:MAG: hypothetical protein Q8J68_07705 [Methanolobus sp.]|uniref:hypothetical protein n=1 Tax=Methanolobus sp. TaxID=1874737 RepID=UPI002730702C|nr:hypothetical protein [Methanolobus sp.]MDP2217152.1 hypothetical protein [Methanolobus sp.]